MIFPNLSAAGQAQRKSLPRWDLPYLAPSGLAANMVLDFESGSYGRNRVAEANPISGARNGVPAVDGGAGGMIVEPARTNQVIWSVSSAANWSAVGSTLADLSQNVLGLFQGLSVASAGAVWHRAAPPAISFDSTKTFCVTLWYSAGSANNIKAILYSTSSTPSTDLEVGGVPGAVGILKQDNGTVFDLRETDLGSGVFRLSFCCTVDATISENWGVGPDSATSGQDVVVYGMQIEEGNAATGYIATNGSVGARVADSVGLAGAGWLSASAGTLLIQTTAGSNGDVPLLRLLETAGGDGLNLVQNAAGTLSLHYADGATTGSLTTLNSQAAYVAAKAAISWSGSGLSLCLNGGTVETGVNTVAPGIDQLDFYDPAHGETYGPELVTQCVHYPSRIADADLQAITS